MVSVATVERLAPELMYFTNTLDEPIFLGIEIEGAVLEIPPLSRIEIRYDRPTEEAPLEVELEDKGIRLYAWVEEVILLEGNANRTRIWPVYLPGKGRVSGVSP